MSANVRLLTYDEMKALLDEHKQEHIYQVLPHFNTQHPIFQQLCSMDIGLSLSHLKCALQSSDAIEVAKDFQPVSSVIDMISMTSGRKELTGNVGREAIKQSKVAAVIMSGGQGTRLGFKGPKGMYNLNMPSQKTIFQIHIEKILRMKKLFSSSDSNATNGISFSPSIPIYIMTSNLNHHIIIDFFKDNSYFGYPPQDIVFFEQGVEPSFTHDGKIIIESESTLSLSPDGNGGIYRALLVAGCIDDMILRGVEHLHIYGIDNILTKSVDPYFIGACIHNQAEVGNKVVWRASKGEKVGVTAQLDGRMHILEYSEIPQQLAESSDSNGKLLFGAANICNHYVSVRFLSEVILPNLSSTYHIAKKKIPYMDVDTRHTVDPSSINGLKIEMFIFDVFPLASRWTVVEVAREDEFAPVKNAPGSEQDSPDTARTLMSNQAKRWLADAGVIIVEKSSSDTPPPIEAVFRIANSPLSVIEGISRETLDESLCEVSPLISYSGEGLSSLSGRSVCLPCYIHEA